MRQKKTVGDKRGIYAYLKDDAGAHVAYDALTLQRKLLGNGK